MEYTIRCPCDSCTYHRIISADPSQIGCSANKTEETCPKLRKFNRFYRRVLAHERHGTFRGYRREIFGQAVLEP